MSSTIIYTGLALLLVILNSYTSYRVWRCEQLERFQQWFQIGLIWLIPVVGGIGIWIYIHSIEGDDNDKPPKPPFGGGPGDSVSPAEVAAGTR